MVQNYGGIYHVICMFVSFVQSVISQIHFQSSLLSICRLFNSDGLIHGGWGVGDRLIHGTVVMLVIFDGLIHWELYTAGAL